MPETTTQELSAKKTLVQSLFKCPHRDLNQTIPVFSNALEKDPLFAGKCFYALTLPDYNRIRDLGEAGVAFLLTSKFQQHRRAGRILFQSLEPYRAYRVARFVRNGIKNPNRQVRKAVEHYLRTLEKDTRRFDGAVRVARKPLHHMYEFYHIKPSPRAQTVLFDRETPPGEVDPVQMLRDAKSPEEQARIIMDHNIPYRQATSALKAMTPAIWVALIQTMTPVEAVNARASIERSGILQDDRIRGIYEDKLRKASESDRVSVSHLKERKSAKGTDKSVEAVTQDVRQQKVDKGAKITVDTVICVDVSGSMEDAIEISKRLCPMVASICDASLWVYCFNNVAWELKYEGNTLADFERAFEMIRADGQTSLGAALQKCVDDGHVPEQAVYVTDQMENTRPVLVDVYNSLISKGTDVRFTFITIGGQPLVASALEAAMADVVDYNISPRMDQSAWYAELENIVPLLTKGGYADLVNSIMELELPS